jgi:MFS family permease
MSDRPLLRAALPIFLLLSAATGISAGVLSLALPLFALSLSATPAEVGLIRAAAGIGLLCAVLPAGFLVDRHGPKMMFGAGSLGMVASVAADRFSTEPAVLVAIAVFEGGFRRLAFNALTFAGRGDPSGPGLPQRVRLRPAMTHGKLPVPR